MQTYTIRNLSEMFSLPASTLRYYEDVELLTNVERHGQKRVYHECHVHRLRTICCFKAAGMSIAQLKLLFQCEDRPEKETEAIQLLQEYVKELSEKIAELQENEIHVKRKLAYYEDQHNARLHNKPLPDWKDYKDAYSR